LLQRAKDEASHVPICVVVANREFEVWFLAACRSFRRKGVFRADCDCLSGSVDLESLAGCKARVGRLLGRKYSETVDQPELVKDLPFTRGMAKRANSYGKLLKELEWLAEQIRSNT
jgi:hypothetical protein